MKYFIVAACIVAVAALGSIFTGIGQDWYGQLVKPSEWPPSFVFPIVWSAIYVLAFFALYACIKDDDKGLKKLFIIAAVNGVLNILWCLLFFTLHLKFLGLVAIIFTLASSILLAVEVYSDKKLWGYIMSVYPLWAGIATALNIAIWLLN